MKGSHPPICATLLSVQGERASGHVFPWLSKATWHDEGKMIVGMEKDDNGDNYYNAITLGDGRFDALPVQ